MLMAMLCEPLQSALSRRTELQLLCDVRFKAQIYVSYFLKSPKKLNNIGIIISYYSHDLGSYLLVEEMHNKVCVMYVSGQKFRELGKSIQIGTFYRPAPILIAEALLSFSILPPEGNSRQASRLQNHWPKVIVPGVSVRNETRKADGLLSPPLPHNLWRTVLRTQQRFRV